MVLTHGNIIYLTSLNPQLSKNIAYVGSASIFLFNFFLHVFCNSTKTSANSSAFAAGHWTQLAGEISLDYQVMVGVLHCTW